MGDNKITEMSKIIGQIEDELLNIKSAKEQAEAVIDSSKDMLESSKNVAEMFVKTTKQIISDVNDKIAILKAQSYSIEGCVQQGISKITQQSNLAQLKLEKDFNSLVQKMCDTISASTNKSLGDIVNEFDEYHGLITGVTKEFSDSTSDMIEKQERQIVEMKKLVTCMQDSQNSLSSKVEELKQFDINRIFDELGEIHKIESESASTSKKWRFIGLIAFGAALYWKSLYSLNYSLREQWILLYST